MNQPNREILPFFAKFIEKESGIIYAEHNHFQLQNRLEDIMRLLGMNDLTNLYDRAKTGIDGPFRQLLIDLATNNETSFFRDPKLFKAMETLFLSSTEAASGGPLRIWSAASSTGQEALSLAMMIEEFNRTTGKKIPYSILGTDISERVLERARTGTYSQLEVQRGLSSPLLVRYFSKDPGDRWQAKDAIRAGIEFKKMNLKDRFPMARPFHLILCRNVLIYQTVAAKKEILSRITEALLPGGILALGSGESLIGLSSDYETLTVEGAILYRKK